MVRPRVDGCDFYGRTEAEQAGALLRILRDAFFELARVGWSPRGRLPQEDEARPEGTLSILEALWAAAGNFEHSPIDVVFARQVLEGVGAWPVMEWEQHRWRSDTEVFELFRKAIRLVGGEVPSLPEPVRTKRRGGWSISSGRAA